MISPKKKRIIFTIHISPEKVSKYFNTTELKMTNLDLYASTLQVKQKDYAESCGADYRIYKFGDKFIDFTEKLWELNIFEEYYQSIQHYKIYILEELTKEYEEVLYLDLDVWPNKFVNIFEEIDVNDGIAIRGFTDDKPKDVESLKEGWLHYKPIPRSVSTKTALMRSLCNDSKIECTSDVVFNTAITLANEKHMNKLNYFGEIEDTRNKIKRLTNNDTFFADYIYCMFRFNNESVFSYLIFKNKVEWQSLDEKWHWVSNHRNPDELCPANVNLAHIINKQFSNIIGLKDKEY